MQESSALLIIDVQRGFITKYTRKLSELAESIQNNYTHVYVTQLEYEEKSPFIDIRKRSGFRDVDNPTELAFEPVASAKIMQKHGYSAVNSELLAELQNNNIGQIDVMGMDTDQCVLATTFGLFDRGITPRVLSKYCASTGGTGLHRAGLKIMRSTLGRQNVI